MVNIQGHAKGNKSTHSHFFGQLGYILAQLFQSFHQAAGYNNVGTNPNKTNSKMTLPLSWLTQPQLGHAK